MTATEVYDTLWRHNVRTKNLPARMAYVKKPDPDIPEGWKENTSACCCGNFEEGSWQKEGGNRSEVPDAYHMRCLTAEASIWDWSVGTADFATAFINAHLSDKEDGVYVVKPPQYLIELGLEEPNVYWKLNRAMRGLRKAPTTWEEIRNAGMKELVVEPTEPGDKQLSLTQCLGAKNIWVIREHQEDGSVTHIGKLLMYVDDVLAFGPTKIVEIMMV